MSSVKGCCLVGETCAAYGGYSSAVIPGHSLGVFGSVLLFSWIGEYLFLAGRLVLMGLNAVAFLMA